MSDEAILSNDRFYTSFKYNNVNIRFKTSAHLEKYTKILLWDNGYIEANAKYDGHPEEEEYIDLIPILKKLYIDPDTFLKPIKKVRIKND